MTTKNYLIISNCALALGIFIFAIQKEYIIFNFGRTRAQATSNAAAQKKMIPLWYWHQNAWHTDTVLLIVSDGSTTTVQQILSRLLQIMHEEKIITKKVTVQSALVHFNTQELFLSFDRLPWNKESSTFEKWMILEGMLKTIKNAAATIKKIHFLINHQPIIDIHLDFTNSWPIDGFL